MKNKIFLSLISLLLVSLPVKAENTHTTKISFGNVVHIITIDDFKKIKPIAKRPGQSLFKYVSTNKAWGGINGGYFNHSDGFPVSKIYIDSNLVEDPKSNKALINNLSLKPIIDKILNKRVELRITENNQGKKVDILANDVPLENNEKLIYSLQAGPLLLPEIGLENEGFIIKNKNKIVRDGIASSQRAARSAVGINKAGKILLVSVSSKPGVTIEQLSKIMSEIGCYKAMALDGGSSVSMVWKEKENYKTFSSMGKNMALINSALLISD